jgi:hypothetical protein
MIYYPHNFALKRWDLDTIKIFVSYAPEDEKLRAELVKQLSVLTRQDMASVWYNRKIAPGLNESEEIQKNLNTAQIILLLLSPDFIASDYYYSVEMTQAIERHKREEAYVIPVLLRPIAAWQDLPMLKQLSLLPTDAVPITRKPDQDEAMVEVVVGITKIAKEKFLHTIDTSLSATRPTPIASMYVPSRVGNRGVASFLLNGKEHILHYTRTDSIHNALKNKSLSSLKKQTILLTYNQTYGKREIVKEEVPELAPLKTLIKQQKFQIEGVDCLFTFRMRALTGIMSIRIEVGGVTVFSH